MMMPVVIMGRGNLSFERVQSRFIAAIQMEKIKVFHFHCHYHPRRPIEPALTFLYFTKKLTFFWSRICPKSYLKGEKNRNVIFLKSTIFLNFCLTGSWRCEGCKETVEELKETIKKTFLPLSLSLSHTHTLYYSLSLSLNLIHTATLFSTSLSNTGTLSCFSFYLTL